MKVESKKNGHPVLGMPSSIVGPLSVPILGQIKQGPRIEMGRSVSRFEVLAENRGLAPCLFVLDVFTAEPKEEGVLILDPRTDPAHLARLESNRIPTDPGKAIQIKVDSIAVNVEANAKGPMLWFRTPKEIRGVFYFHVIRWNDYDLLKAPGVV